MDKHDTDKTEAAPVLRPAAGSEILCKHDDIQEECDICIELSARESLRAKHGEIYARIDEALWKIENYGLGYDTSTVWDLKEGLEILREVRDSLIQNTPVEESAKDKES